ncbi:MAG: amino acid permease [Bacteroidetes bacterium]|nr:amino acid permease [Bacteroidota bacterium]MBL0079800.1 amino acid permease [Bacteroidota bacterium]MBL0287724.1 amino acid permease [Bacteroidota bacterium]
MISVKELFRTKSVKKILEDSENLSDGHESAGLHKHLGVKDLTSFGIAAVIGAGIFSTIGKACFDGGPGVILLFLGIAIACGFSALCYAEFASRIPISGSAYTYSYAVFGELIAWIIGWDLLLEYAIGNVTVAISWSGNFTNFLHGFGIDLPRYLTTSFLEAKNNIPELWNAAPKLLGIPFIINVPAFMINLFITLLVYIGIKESKNFANGMVLFKIGVILMVIVIGFFYVNPSNWVPFLPNGVSGVMKGVSAVFFAYIGFDAISTTAEECKNPQRDLPKGMMYALIISTVLYILVALALTGMVSYENLNTEAFLATAFTNVGLTKMGGLIAFSALIATASVMLVFQIGQPRIWMSMSRDGLLPKKFASIHPKFKTPGFATIVTGFLVGIPSLFLDASLVTDMCSIGTLFAFILVCGGVLILQQRDNQNADDNQLAKPKFKTPYINGQFIIPIFTIISFIVYFKTEQNVKDSFPFAQGFEVWKHQIPFWIFLIVAIYMSIKTFINKWSFIPVMGFLSCSLLISTLGITNWLRFFIWMLIGIIIYVAYGYRNSKLRKS